MDFGRLAARVPSQDAKGTVDHHSPAKSPGAPAPAPDMSTAPESGPPYDGPSLIVCGRQDAVTGYADQYELLPHYPRATYAVLDVAGHNLQLEQPALFGALIREWLQRLPQTATSG